MKGFGGKCEINKGPPCGIDQNYPLQSLKDFGIIISLWKFINQLHVYQLKGKIFCRTLYDSDILHADVYNIIFR